MGSYNPDWAVLVERDGTERLYFVVETKDSLFDEDLRDREGGKIICGTAHFKALAVGRTRLFMASSRMWMGCWRTKIKRGRGSG